MHELDGKAIIITGSGGGLGAAYAKHAAALGAAIVVNDMNPEAAHDTVSAIKAAGGQAVAQPGDVAEWAFAETLVETCMAAFGTVSGLVNNAGILRIARMEDVTEADMHRMIGVNLMSTIACGQAVARQLKKLGTGGSIINVSSGSQAGDIALGGYGATKSAIASLTFSWAMELRGTGVRMNAISPLAETAMAAQNKHLMALQSQSREVHYASLPPAEANAPVVSFLLSDAASDIHGQIVRIAGRQLSFVTHPMIASPVMEDDWTFDKVSHAFSKGLSSHQQSLGLGFAK